MRTRRTCCIDLSFIPYPASFSSCGPLAQLVEQLTLNQRVRSSSLRRPTFFPSTPSTAARAKLRILFFTSLTVVCCPRSGRGQLKSAHCLPNYLIRSHQHV